MKTMRFVAAVTMLLLLFMSSAATAGPVMDRILSSGELVVGITGNQPPLNAVTRNGEIIGLDADLARLMALSLGVRISFKTMPFSDLLAALDAGKVDMVISGLTMTAERNRKAAFIGPYHLSGKGVLTKTAHVAALAAPSGLNSPDISVAVLKNSTSQTFIERAAPKAQLVLVDNYETAIEKLDNDEIKALVADAPFCAYAAFRYKDKGLIAGDALLSSEPLGIALPEDTLLINWVENFLGFLNVSGQLEQMRNRWFRDGSWIKELP